MRSTGSRVCCFIALIIAAHTAGCQSTTISTSGETHVRAYAATTAKNVGVDFSVHNYKLKYLSLDASTSKGSQAARPTSPESQIENLFLRFPDGRSVITHVDAEAAGRHIANHWATLTDLVNIERNGGFWVYQTQKASNPNEIAVLDRLLRSPAFSTNAAFMAFVSAVIESREQTAAQTNALTQK